MKESNYLIGILTIVLIVSITYVLSATQCDANGNTENNSWSSTRPAGYNPLAPPAHELAWSSTPPAGYSRLAPPMVRED